MRQSIITVRVLSYVIVGAATVLVTFLAVDAQAAAQGQPSTSTAWSGTHFVVSAVALLATAYWLIRLRNVAAVTAPEVPHRRDTFWALGGWVIPIVSLWFPYQLIADLNRALGARVRGLLVWWAGWLVAFELIDVLSTGGGATDSVVGPTARLAAGAVAFVWWCWIVIAFTAAAEREARTAEAVTDEQLSVMP